MAEPIEHYYFGELDDFEDLDFSMVNPYSGEEETVAGNYYVQNREFKGGDSDQDTLISYSSINNAIFLSGVPLSQGIGGASLGGEEQQMFFDLEIFTLGQGNNIFNFASTSIGYGNMEVHAIGGNNLIWTNAGNDKIYAASGNDRIDAGPGDDYIRAGSGNDELRGGDGVDQLWAEDGADILYFNADNTWSGYGGSMNMSFVALNAYSGQRVSVSTSNQGHDLFDGGSGVDSLLLTDGNDALFLHDDYSPFAFGPNTPRLVSIEIIFAGDGDDIVDLTSPTMTYGDVDIYGGSGNDVLWGNVGEDNLFGEDGNDNLDGGAGDDYIVGGAGDDVMYGRGGNDYFVVGEGKDTIYGGEGSDTIRYDFIDNLTDKIVGFEVGLGKDVLNIYSILDGYDPATKILSDFVYLVANLTVGGTDLMVNHDGDTGGAFVALATFDTAINDPIEALISNHNLIV